MANLTADVEALELLETIDAARLLWSLLKHPSPVVQAGAASAIAAFSERSKVNLIFLSKQIVFCFFAILVFSLTYHRELVKLPAVWLVDWNF